MSDSAPQTAARLLQRAPAIMRRWEERVRAEVPAAKSQQPSVLQNNLRRLLAEVARSLAPSSALEELIEGLTIAQDHGGSRAELAEYSLAEVFFEYRLLIPPAFDWLAERGAVQISYSTRTRAR